MCVCKCSLITTILLVSLLILWHKLQQCVYVSRASCVYYNKICGACQDWSQLYIFSDHYQVPMWVSHKYTLSTDVKLIFLALIINPQWIKLQYTFIIDAGSISEHRGTVKMEVEIMQDRRGSCCSFSTCIHYIWIFSTWELTCILG